LASLIIEAMCHFMADDRPDSAVVHRVICVRVEEWRPQNAGRKDDLVHGRVVISIHSRRGHSPIGAIDRLADFLQVPIGCKFF
jgi:hypothetical protein